MLLQIIFSVKHFFTIFTLMFLFIVYCHMTIIITFIIELSEERLKIDRFCLWVG